jgi:hypothetical protein
MAKPMPPLEPEQQEGGEDAATEEEEGGEAPMGKAYQQQGRVQQEAIAAMAAVPHPNKPRGQDLANDPVVCAAIEKAWEDSLPYAPDEMDDALSPKKEQGGWIIQNEDGSGVIPVDGRNRNYIDMGERPVQAVGLYHTHPGSATEGYMDPPSTQDRKNAKALGLPSIVRGHGGYYYVNP